MTLKMTTAQVVETSVTASVRGKIISGMYVVVAKIRHSQQMNDPLVNVWIITETEGMTLSAHCSGCKAGLAKSCSHVASAMIYINCWTYVNRNNGTYTSKMLMAPSKLCQ